MADMYPSWSRSNTLKASFISSTTFSYENSHFHDQSLKKKMVHTKTNYNASFDDCYGKWYFSFLYIENDFLTQKTYLTNF